MLRRIPQDLTDDKSTLVQVMAGCRQATSHYQSQCWPRSMPQCGVTRPQRVNDTNLARKVHCYDWLIEQMTCCCLSWHNTASYLSSDGNIKRRYMHIFMLPLKCNFIWIRLFSFDGVTYNSIVQKLILTLHKRQNRGAFCKTPFQFLDHDSVYVFTIYN